MSASIDWSAVNLETGEVRVTNADLSMPNGGIRCVFLPFFSLPSGLTPRLQIRRQDRRLLPGSRH